MPANRERDLYGSFKIFNRFPELVTTHIETEDEKLQRLVKEAVAEALESSLWYDRLMMREDYKDLTREFDEKIRKAREDKS